MRTSVYPKTRSRVIRHTGWCEPRLRSVVHGINIPEFNARAEEEALARVLFYEDVDSGKYPGLQRAWTPAPLHLKDWYRALARRVNRIKVAPVVRQNRWYHQLFARFLGGQA